MHARARTCVAVVEDVVDGIGRVCRVYSGLQASGKYSTLQSQRRAATSTAGAEQLNGSKRTMAMTAHSGELNASMPTPWKRVRAILGCSSARAVRITRAWYSEKVHSIHFPPRFCKCERVTACSASDWQEMLFTHHSKCWKVVIPLDRLGECKRDGYGGHAARGPGPDLDR